MNSLLLTEKQQEVLWMRYERRATITQIAWWLKISRRAVLARLSNARRRTQRAGMAFPDLTNSRAERAKPRLVSASQVSANLDRGLQFDEL